MYLLPYSRTMANKIETSSKNIKPRINLNHNIYIMLVEITLFYIIAICCNLIPVPVMGSNYQNFIWTTDGNNFNISTIYGLIIDSHNDQLPVGLIAQLEEHCTGIAEVSVWVTFRPEFFRAFFPYCITKLRRSFIFRLVLVMLKKSLKPGETYCTVIKCGHLGDWRTVVILTVILTTYVEVMFTVKTLYFQIVETEQFLSTL